MNEFEINDKREPKELKSISFSKYKKSDVKKKLLEQLYKENLEQSLYWSCELICSGAFMDLWELIILYVSAGLPLVPGGTVGAPGIKALGSATLFAPQLAFISFIF